MPAAIIIVASSLLLLLLLLLVEDIDKKGFKSQRMEEREFVKIQHWVGVP